MNPVIVSSLLGIGFAWWGIPMPVIIDRSLKIVSGMALPLALLLIGATLSLSLIKTQFVPALLSSAIKLLAMPALGAAMFAAFGLPPADYLPALILLAAPPATLTYVFAKEMQGDGDLAVAAISLGTVLSGPTYWVWLHIFG
jgi:predicted permease